MDGTPAAEPELDLDYQLADNLTRSAGRIFLTGTQALVRIMLTQRRLDRERGLNTAGFVSGYRGSPLGGVDMAMWKAKKALDDNQISFLPGINEDMAATAVMGTQQAGMRADRKVDGVFAMWYGKGPGWTAPATRCTTATPRAPRATAACWWWWATTTPPSRPRSRTPARPR